MKKTLLATAVALLLSAPAYAANAIIDNEYVRAGINETTGSFGSGGNTSPGLLYDSTGTSTFNTSYDYLTPGSPFDGFAVKVDGTNYDNNNAGGITNIPAVGGLTVSSDGNTVTWNGAFTHSSSTWSVENIYRLPDTVPYIDITTRITAGSAATQLWFGRFIDPDARAASGDSSVTDNVVGYGAIPANNVVFSEALSSRYALGLYSTDVNVDAGVQGWTREADGYQDTHYGANYGTGDDTIGLSWVFNGVSAGDILTMNYAYIFGPNAFGAASLAITGGAGGGDISILTGTLTDVGSATDAASTPSTPPAPTLVSTSAPYIDNTSYSSWSNWSVNGALPVLTSSITHHTASDNGEVQIIARETTTTVTTPEQRSRTYNIIETETYSDSSTIDNLLSTETETELRNNVAVSVTNPGSFVGRVDQIQTARSVNSMIGRSLDFDGIKLIGVNSEYDNGMTGDTGGFSIGGQRNLDNGFVIGAGLAGFNTRLSNIGDSVAADTVAVELRLGKAIGTGQITASLRQYSTDYKVQRTIGDFSNGAVTQETDTSVKLQYTGKIGDHVKPIVAITSGSSSVDAYDETGSVQSARTVSAVDDNYEYATIGAEFNVGVLRARVLRHSDDVSEVSLGIVRETDKISYSVTANKTTTNVGDSVQITAGINIKF